MVKPLSFDRGIKVLSGLSSHGVKDYKKAWSVIHRWQESSLEKSKADLFEFLRVYADNPSLRRCFMQRSLLEVLSLFFPKEPFSEVELEELRELTVFSRHDDPNAILVDLLSKENVLGLPSSWFINYLFTSAVFKREDLTFGEARGLFDEHIHVFGERAKLLYVCDLIDREDASFAGILSLVSESSAAYTGDSFLFERLSKRRVFSEDEIRQFPFKLVAWWNDCALESVLYSWNETVSANFKNAAGLVEKFKSTHSVEFWEAFKDSWEGSFESFEAMHHELGK